MNETEMIEVEIDRTHWVRGTGSDLIESPIYGFSKLENEKGNMCCLGFLAKKCGYENILNIPSPIALFESQHTFLSDIKKGFEFLFSMIGNSVINSDYSRELMRTNDTVRYSDEEREILITEIFIRNNIKVTFIN